jgi:tetratricopeptide (TPR) repeat protein
LDTGESVFTKPKDFDPVLQKQWEGQVKQQSAQESAAKEEKDQETKKAEAAKNAEAMKEAGNASFRAKHYAQALAQYTEAIIILPRNVTYRCNRAACLLQLKQWSRAEADAKECTRLEPQSIKGHVRLLKARMGLLEAKQGGMKLSTVIKTLKAGLAVEPKNKELAKIGKEIKAQKMAADEAKGDEEARRKSVAEEVQRRLREREEAVRAKERAAIEAKVNAENARRSALRSLVEGRRKEHFQPTKETQLSLASSQKPMVQSSDPSGDIVSAELPWATETLVRPTEVGEAGDGSGAGLVVNVASGIEVEDVMLRIPLEHTLHSLMLHPTISRSAHISIAVVVEMQPAVGSLGEGKNKDANNPDIILAASEFVELTQHSLSENEKLVMLLLLERSKGEASRHYEQILRMPLTYDLPVCWDTLELDELQGSSWLAVINKLRAQTLTDHIGLWKKLNAIVNTGVASPTLQKLVESLRITTKAGSTGGAIEQNIDVVAHTDSESWQLYLWAYCVLSSRATDLTVDFLPRGYSYDTGPDRKANKSASCDNEGRLRLLVPGFDLFNHDPSLAQTKRTDTENALADGQQTHFWNAADGTVCVRATTAYKEGDEAHISYGARSNGHLLLWYGFTLEQNPHDCVLLYLTLERSQPQQRQDESGIADLGAEEEVFRMKRKALIAGGLRAHVRQAAAGVRQDEGDKGPKHAWEDPEGVEDARLENQLWGEGDFVVEHKLQLVQPKSKKVPKKEEEMLSFGGSSSMLSFGGTSFGGSSSKEEEVRVASEGVDSMLQMVRIMSLGEPQVMAMNRLRSGKKRRELRAKAAHKARSKKSVAKGFLDKKSKTEIAKEKKAEADAEKEESGMEYGGQRPISLGHEQAILAELRSMMQSMLAQYPSSLAEDEAELRQLEREGASASEGVDGLDAALRRKLLSVRLRMGEKRTYEAVIEELDRRQEDALEFLMDADGDY